jgi:hypothetical protein
VSMLHGQWAEVAKRLKLERVRRHGLSNSAEVDVPTTTLVVRGGDTIALLYGQGPNGGRATAYWAALFFRPEEVISLSDSYYREEKPGEEGPKQGELSRDWAEGRREGMTEAIVAIRMAADEPAQAIMFPYERKANKLRWLTWDGPAQKVEGAIADSAQMGFDEAKTTDLPIASLGAYGDAEAPGQFERAVARLVSQKDAVAGVVVMWPKVSFWRDGQEE